MQIIYILNNMWCYLTSNHKNRSKYDLDAKYWIQSILLKNYLKSIDKNNWLKKIINLNVIIRNFWAPVAQLDRALGYGPGGSGFKS